jgi:hypothetical protein
MGGRWNWFIIRRLPVATSCRLAYSVNVAYSANRLHARLSMQSHKNKFHGLFKEFFTRENIWIPDNVTLANPVQGLWNVCRRLFIRSYS